jgi:repressor of nif and glnA expression
LYSVAKGVINQEGLVKTSHVYQIFLNQFGHNRGKRQVRNDLESLKERGLLYRETTNNGRDSKDAGRYHEYGLDVEFSRVVESLGDAGFEDTELLQYLCEDAVSASMIMKEEKDRIIDSIGV